MVGRGHSMKKIFSMNNARFAAIANLLLGFVIFGIVVGYYLYESSFDSHITNSERIYRIVSSWADDERTITLARAPGPIKPLAQSIFDAGDDIILGRMFRYKIIFEIEGKSRNIENTIFVEPEGAKLLGLTTSTGFPTETSAYISEEFARRYFSSADVVGKTMLLSGRSAVTIAGVISQWPKNSHLKIDVVVPFSMLADFVSGGGEAGQATLEYMENDWVSSMFYNYMLLPSGQTSEDVARQLNVAIQDHPDPFVRNSLSVDLQPLRSIHLDPPLDLDVHVPSDKKALIALLCLGLLVLVIAVANYGSYIMRTLVRQAREFAVMSAMGQSMRRLLLSCAAVTAFDLLVVTALTTLVYAGFIQANLQAIHPVLPLVSAIVLTFFASTVVSYIGLKKVLGAKVTYLRKRSGVASSSSKRLTRLLVGLQAAFVASLCFLTAIIYFQVQELKNARLGYNGDEVAVLYGMYPRPALMTRYHDLRDALKASPYIQSAAASGVLPTQPVNSIRNLVMQDADETKVSLPYITVDYDFFDVYQIAIQAGRVFQRDRGEDSFVDPTPSAPVSRASIVLSEAAVNSLGWEVDEAVGKQILERVESESGASLTNVFTVIGVVSNVHFGSARNRSEPMMYFVNPLYFNPISIRVSPGQLDLARAQIAGIWNAFTPSIPLELRDFPEVKAENHAADARLLNTMLLLAIPCLALITIGVFTAAVYLQQNNRARYGLLRALGATRRWVGRQAGAELMVPALIGIGCILIPILYLANYWLSQFHIQYDATLPVGLSVTVGTLLTFLTIGFLYSRATNRVSLAALINRE